MISETIQTPVENRAASFRLAFFYASAISALVAVAWSAQKAAGSRMDNGFAAVAALIAITGVLAWRATRAAHTRALIRHLRAEIGEMRGSNAMFRELIEAAPDAMVIVDANGTIEFFNAQAERMFGFKAGDIIGETIETIIPARFRAAHILKRDAYFADPKTRRMGVGRELYGVRQDGAEFPIEISLSPVKTPSGLRISSAIRDVTQRKQEDVALKQLNEELQARTWQFEMANKELESFSYSVSHDLRGPLRSIDGFSQAVLEDCADKLDDQGREHLRRVRAASQRMSQLIDDLLNLSRVTRAELHREPVDLSAMAEEIVQELRCAQPERCAEFVIASELATQADARLVRIIFTNLLGNSFKFTANQQSARIEFGKTSATGEAVYFVRDNGAGFDMNYAGKLFGAFQRLHTAAEFPGTGIGLATVHRIVQRHGGRIWAEGRVGDGATFYFTFRESARSDAA